MSIARAQGTAVLTIEGVVDAAGTERLEHLLGDLIEGQGNQSIVMDLRDVESVDQSMLALLVSVTGSAGAFSFFVIRRRPLPMSSTGWDWAALSRSE